MVGVTGLCLHEVTLRVKIYPQDCVTVTGLKEYNLVKELFTVKEFIISLLLIVVQP